MKIFILLGAAFFLAFPAIGQSSVNKNIIIFVADGLRSGSVNAQSAPTFDRIRTEGVYFSNSHSLFPTVTTTNASTIATGHAIGDTGNFSNQFFVGYPLFDGQKPQDSVTQVASVKNNAVIKDLNIHYGGNYLGEISLLAWAQMHGFSTAAIGKMGPTLIQDVGLANLVGTLNRPAISTIVIDNATGTTHGVPLPHSILEAMRREGLPETVPNRVDGFDATSSALQQRYFTNLFLKVVLPELKKAEKPFIAVYWCAEPDNTQHNQKDSLSQFVPGINGAASLAAIKTADENLQRIIEYINNNPQLAKSTNIFVTADHGFSTISKKWLNAKRTKPTSSYSAGFNYRNRKAEIITPVGSLPLGFLAIDLAHTLGMRLFDPDDTPIFQNDALIYPEVDPRGINDLRQYPVRGNGLIGHRAVVSKDSGAEIVVVNSGGCDLIYLTKPDRQLASRIVSFLTTQDYVGGIFVNKKQCGRLPGALGLDQIQLEGATKLPIPTIVVSFRNFALDSANPLQAQVSISDTSGQEGQGSHGGFGRGDTFNFMAAIGPDFKKRYLDFVPVSNADIAITCARILGLKLPSVGNYQGRVIEEALVGGPATLVVTTGTLTAHPTSSGLATQVIYQDVGKHRYFDAGGFPGRFVGNQKIPAK